MRRAKPLKNIANALLSLANYGKRLAGIIYDLWPVGIVMGMLSAYALTTNANTTKPRGWNLAAD
jgi:hypothetical protein